MSFNPDAFLAETEPKNKTSFNPDAFLAETEPNVSKTESLIRGGVQSATLGFSDEITAGLAGGLPALLKGQDVKEAYNKRLEEARSANKAAAEANPKSYLAGEIGGGVASSLVPGLGAAKGAAGIAKLAGLGAVAGAGYSEAKDMGGLAKDAAIGGLAAGALGGVAKGLGAASKAAAKGTKEFIETAPARAREIVLQQGLKPGSLGSKIRRMKINPKALDTTEEALHQAADKQASAAIKEASKQLIKDTALGATGYAVGSTVGGDVGGLLGAVVGGQRLMSSVPKAATLAVGANATQSVINKSSKALAQLVKSKATGEALAKQVDDAVAAGADPSLVARVAKTKTMPKATLHVTDKFEASPIAPGEISMKIVDPATSKKIGQAIVWQADPRSVNELGKTGFSLKDIRVDKDYQGSGIAKDIVEQLTDKFGTLASDTRGNISKDGLKLLNKLGEKQKDGSFIIKSRESKSKLKDIDVTGAIGRTAAGRLAEDED